MNVDRPPVRVSVMMITYNHERFIEKAINSVLGQRTSFLVEIVVGEDCSTDSTREIVMRLAEEHPDSIRPLLPSQNIGAAENFMATFRACRGEYIAVLEGDDYWTDPLKLQKQVDVLDNDPTAVICHHNAVRVDADNAGSELVWAPGTKKRRLKLVDMLSQNELVSCSTVYRNGVLSDLPDWIVDCPVSDWPLQLLLALHGDAVYIDEPMAGYRFHSDAWSAKSTTRNLELRIKVVQMLKQHLPAHCQEQLNTTLTLLQSAMIHELVTTGKAQTAREYAQSHACNREFLRSWHFVEGIRLEREGSRVRAIAELAKSALSRPSQSPIGLKEIAFAVPRIVCPWGYGIVRHAYRLATGKSTASKIAHSVADITNGRSVCVIAYDAYPVVEPSCKAMFGGVETSAWLSAKALAIASDSPVYFLVQTLIPRRPRLVSGVNVLFRWRPVEIIRRSVDGYLEVSSKFPFILVSRLKLALIWQIPFLALARVVRPRKPETNRIDRFFDRLPGDVLFSFGVHSVSASVVANAERLNRQAIVSVQSNASLDPRIMKDENYIDDYGETANSCRFALRRASQVIVQSAAQDIQLQSVFGIKGTLIENPFDLEAWCSSLVSSSLPAEIVDRRFVLWVGRADTIHKRPFALLEIAKLCPRVSFLMILNDGDEGVKREVIDNRPENVFIVDRIAFQQMPAVFEKAAIFISTGTKQHEGFPNVLLQSAASKVPILSLDFLPQEIVDSKFGFVAGNEVNLAQRTRQIWDDPNSVADEVQRGFEFVKAFQTPQEYGALLLSVVNSLPCADETSNPIS